MGVTTWTDAQDAQLLDGLKADRTYTQIATNLGVSKAMVSGRLYRLRQLRPDDVPQKQVQTKKRQIKKATDRIPKVGSRAKILISQNDVCKLIKGNLKPDLSATFIPNDKFKTPKNSNTPKRKISLHKPNNQPIEFMALERGYCLWCVDEERARSPANMLCCAAPVIDAAKRDGDRRSSHCAYHYELSCRVKVI